MKKHLRRRIRLAAGMSGLLGAATIFLLSIALAVGQHWGWGFGILLVPLWIMAAEAIIYRTLDD